MEERLEGPDALSVDPASRRARVGEHELELPRAEFDLLVELLRHRGQAIELADLGRAAWALEDVPHAHAVRAAVYRLRWRLGQAGVHGAIEALSGRGFRLSGDRDAPVAPAIGERALALESSATAIFLINPARQIVWANQAASQLTGYTGEELQALPSSADLAPPSQRDWRARAWLAVLEGAHRSRRHVDLVRKDGRQVSVSGSWKPLRGQGGAIELAILEFWSATATRSDSGCRAAG